MKNIHGVDFVLIVKNAEKQGIDLSEIALFYEGLTDEELNELSRRNLVTEITSKCVIGRFDKEGIPHFPNKVTSVYSLGA